MTSSWINIKGVVSFQDTSVDQRDAENILDQVLRDAVFGTYERLSVDFGIKPSELIVCQEVTRRADRAFEFRLSVAANLFPPDAGGIQHLIGILAGDLFTMYVTPEPSFKIEEVEFPSVSPIYSKANATLQRVRSAFRLQQLEPLKAFSVKPRNGLSHEKLREIAEVVLNAGFHLVELDTRRLVLDETDFAALLAITETVARMPIEHCARFVINLSSTRDRLLSMVSRIMEANGEDPVVVKIDGGLDGITECQSITEAFGTSRPIITCYPLLRKQLSDHVPADFYNNSLVYSGADILYPGGRPNLGSAGRQIDATATAALVEAVRNYFAYTSSGAFMPTVAGGIHAGELHAFYELLGPDVAYFMGGAVALHRDGIAEGARLCADVLAAAVSIRKAQGKGRPQSDLDQDLILRIEAAYPVASGKPYPYISPRDLLSAYPTLRSWFES